MSFYVSQAPHRFLLDYSYFLLFNLIESESFRPTHRRYMIAGHAAGIAAAMAVAGDLAVHDVDVRLLQDELVREGQVLHRNVTLS